MQRNCLITGYDSIFTKNNIIQSEILNKTLVHLSDEMLIASAGNPKVIFLLKENIPDNKNFLLLYIKNIYIEQDKLDIYIEYYDKKHTLWFDHKLLQFTLIGDQMQV